MGDKRRFRGERRGGRKDPFSGLTPTFMNWQEETKRPKEKAAEVYAPEPLKALTEKAVVKNYNADRGFGFVKTDSGDLFFHINALRKGGFVGDPQPGDVLLIVRGPGKDGREAVSEATKA